MLSWVKFNALNKSSLDYTALRRYERKQVYKQYVKEQEVPSYKAITGEWITYGSTTNSLAQLPSAVPSTTLSGNTSNWFTVDEVKQEGNNPMNYASASISTPATETQDQRKYLERRLFEVYADKRDPLESLFGLLDDHAPQTPAELAARIADGKFTIRGTGDDTKNAAHYRYWGAAELIQWRDPAKKADMDGFKAAKDALKAERQKALDIIKIDDPKSGLEAIKALEAWTPTGAAN